MTLPPELEDDILVRHYIYPKAKKSGNYYPQIGYTWVRFFFHVFVRVTYGMSAKGRLFDSHAKVSKKSMYYVLPDSLMRELMSDWMDDPKKIETIPQTVQKPHPKIMRQLISGKKMSEFKWPDGVKISRR